MNCESQTHSYEWNRIHLVLLENLRIPSLMGRESFWMNQSKFYSLCLYEREQWYLFGWCVGTLSLKYTVKQSITNLYLQTWGSLCCSQHIEVLRGAQGMICTECLHAGWLRQRCWCSIRLRHCLQFLTQNFCCSFKLCHVLCRSRKMLKKSLVRHFVRWEKRQETK